MPNNFSAFHTTVFFEIPAENVKVKSNEIFAKLLFVVRRWGVIKYEIYINMVYMVGTRIPIY